jgi:hypothetical protein
MVTYLDFLRKNLVKWLIRLLLWNLTLRLSGPQRDVEVFDGNRGRQ